MKNSNFEKLAKDLFRRETGAVYDMMTGQMGLKRPEGIYSGNVVADEDGSTEIQVTLNALDSFTVEIPAYSMRVAMAEVKIGDLIFSETGILGWAEAVNPKSIDVRKVNGQVTKGYAPPKVINSIFPAGEIRVLRSIGNFDNPAAVNGGLQSILPLLMLGDNDEQLDEVLPLVLLSGINKAGEADTGLFGGNGIQTLLMMKMMKSSSSAGGDKFDKLLPLMMMGGFGGQQAAGQNPMQMLLMAQLLK